MTPSHARRKRYALLTAVAVALGALLLVWVSPAVGADTTKPRAQAYSPPAGSANVSVDVEPWVRFDEPIDEATLTAATFYIHPAAGGAALPATISYGSNKAILSPASSLQDGVTYEVVVTTGIKDLAGNPLESEWSWTFGVVESTPDVVVDVPAGAPYYDAIQGMFAAGVIDGYVEPGGIEFRPGNPIWRQQFAKMVCRAYDIEVTDDMTSPFTDLDAVDSPSSLYPHEYIAAAYLHGITTGITPTTFAPYRDISRAQVITMGVRALQQVAPSALSTPPAGYVSTWGTGFSSIHGPNARLAEYNGLLDGLGMDGSHPAGNLAALDPWGVMSRGEVAQFLWNARALLP